MSTLWLYILMACTAILPHRPAKEALPDLNGNWKGYATDEKGERYTVLFIIRQDSIIINGFSRSYLDPGAYAECHLTGALQLAETKLELQEDSILNKKNTGLQGPLSMEGYRLSWNQSADTLRGFSHNVRRGKLQKRAVRKILLWKVKPKA